MASMRALAPVCAVLIALLVTGTAWGYTGSATAYHSCDGSGTVTASGQRARWGIAANNWLPFHTWIEMRHPRKVGGRRFFQIEDRGGPGFVLDFWAKSCSWMYSWGRRTVTFRVIPHRGLWRGRPKAGWYWRCCWRRPHWKA